MPIKLSAYEVGLLLIGRLPHVRKSKTVLDCGFHAVDSEFQVLYFGFFDRGTWIPDSSS